MDLTTSKGRGNQGMRVAPRCRGAASSMLRLHASPSVFGGLGRAGTVAQRLTQSLAMLPLGAWPAAAEPSREASRPSVAPGRPKPQTSPLGGSERSELGGPFITRLWPSASFGRGALWQDTLVALD